jgi:1-acyl-sn-glycerol-3-phosphate acyltransferase
MSDAADKKVAKWDPDLTRQIVGRVGPLIKRYFRAEVRDLEHVPTAGGALVVSNHSGGMFTPDVLVFAPQFYNKFGFDRPVYTLGHDMIFLGPIGDLLHRAGENVVDFNGRKGYVRTAIESGVPIVPMVSIGAQETQLFLARGDSIARRLGLNRLRAEILPISIGFPFGLSVFFPPNVPLPSKIVTRILEPIDIVAEFGENPDVDMVDLHVRAVMQEALDELARERRFPVLG